MSKNEAELFHKAYQLHQDIQNHRASVFTLNNDEGELLKRGLKVVRKYVPVEVVVDDDFDWLAERIENR